MLIARQLYSAEYDPRTPYDGSIMRDDCMQRNSAYCVHISRRVYSVEYDCGAPSDAYNFQDKQTPRKFGDVMLKVPEIQIQRL